MFAQPITCSFVKKNCAFKLKKSCTIFTKLSLLDKKTWK